MSERRPERRRTLFPRRGAAQAAAGEPRPVLPAASWVGEATMLCSDGFEPIAELLLELGALSALGLVGQDRLGLDADVALVRSARLGFGLRRHECAHVPMTVVDEPSDVTAIALSAARANGLHSAGPLGVVDVAVDLAHEHAPDPLEVMPGTAHAERVAAIEHWVARHPERAAVNGAAAARTLMRFGYVLHRAAELRAF